MTGPFLQIIKKIREQQEDSGHDSDPGSSPASSHSPTLHPTSSHSPTLHPTSPPSSSHSPSLPPTSSPTLHPTSPAMAYYPTTTSGSPPGSLPMSPVMMCSTQLATSTPLTTTTTTSTDLSPPSQSSHPDAQKKFYDPRSKSALEKIR